jgi:hypothetical protein
MVRDGDLLEQFERNLARASRPDYQRNLEIYEGMLQEALYLKVLPLENPLEGIDIDIRIAKVVNSV